MSHIVVVQTSFKDLAVLEKVAKQRSVPIEVAERGRTLTRTLYQGPVTGVAALKLKGWRYDAVVQEDGSCKADNYSGAWGKQEELDGLAQDYGAELVTATLRKQGYRIQRDRVEADGTRELVFVS